MDLGLESISRHQAAITLQALRAGRARDPALCSVRGRPGAEVDGTYFLSCVCL